MKKFEQKFNTIGQSVHLTDAEKARMREYLLEYQAMKPLRAAPARALLRKKTPFSFFSFKYVIAAAVIFLIGAGGVSAAAENALPGDILYPIKVSVNENVSGALAISDDAKATHETALAGTRLAEAEALSAKNDLSTSTAATLQASFTADADSARSHIARLEGSDTARAEADLSSFATTLSASKGVLTAGSNDSAKETIVSAIRSEAAIATNLAPSVSDTNAPEAAAPALAAKTAIPAVAPRVQGFRARTGKPSLRALLEAIAATTTPASGSAATTTISSD